MKPKFVVVPNLETRGPRRFWDVVNAQTKEIWAAGYFSKSEAEFRAGQFAERFDELEDLPKWRPKYRGEIHA